MRLQKIVYFRRASAQTFGDTLMVNIQMKKYLMRTFLIFLLTANTASAYEDRASPDIKRHMLLELYELIEIDRTVANYERNALLPAIQDVDGWGEQEHRCIMQDVHDYLQQPIFDELLLETPSELIAENVMFYQSEFGRKVNRVVIHGSGLSALSPPEQEQIKKNVAALTFLQLLTNITQQSIAANMEQALEPAILSCTPDP